MTENIQNIIKHNADMFFIPVCHDKTINTYPEIPEQYEMKQIPLESLKKGRDIIEKMKKKRNGAMKGEA